MPQRRTFSSAWPLAGTRAGRSTTANWPWWQITDFMVLAKGPMQMAHRAAACARWDPPAGVAVRFPTSRASRCAPTRAMHPTQPAWIRRVSVRGRACRALRPYSRRARRGRRSWRAAPARRACRHGECGSRSCRRRPHRPSGAWSCRRWPPRSRLTSDATPAISSLVSPRPSLSHSTRIRIRPLAWLAISTPLKSPIQRPDHSSAACSSRQDAGTK